MKALNAGAGSADEISWREAYISGGFLISRQVAAKGEAFQKMNKKGDPLLFVGPCQPTPACDESLSVAYRTLQQRRS